MKKIILALGVMFLSATMAFAVIGPLEVDQSNVLPNGNYYGSVTVKQTSPTCVQITADANQNILIPGSNFGIQEFGFNYSGNPSCLQLTLPMGWGDSTNGNIDGFGKFIEDTSGTGSNRQDPLVFTVCSTCGNLAESDVIVKNSKGYTFVMHIADFTYDGNSYNGTDSGFFATQKTTEIELSSFTAKPSNSRVTLAWVTESEVDNAGFNIWRAETENGEYVKLNDEIIPAQGSAFKGAKYVFTDNIAKNRKTYFYKLQDIDVYGKSTFHGPVSATPKFLLGILNK